MGNAKTTIEQEGMLNGPERKRALYEAFAAHDVRFDGQIFVGVSSTGIYCRPVCHAKLPKYENCTFFDSAAEAEANGYRPCMTCRPELAPGLAPSDASASLARRAATFLQENCTRRDSIEKAAGCLGYTGRHLRRVFERELSVTPQQYLQTCRLHLAKSLLTDSDIPVSQVALASGFGSVRRFNDVFKAQYRMTPSTLRTRRKSNRSCDSGIVFHVDYRPPYLFAPLLGFFRARHIEGAEKATDDAYMRTVRIPADGKDVFGWVRVRNVPKRSSLEVTMSDSLLPATSQVISRIRRQFDTDCDPKAIFEGLRSLDDVAPGARIMGTRLPGCFDPFEMAVRAILGQQVTISAANTLAGRIARAFGTPVETGIDGLDRAFPSAKDVLSIENIEDAFGNLGVIRSHTRCIKCIAEMLEGDELDFSSGAIVSHETERLLSVKGIEPWTADYLSMRVFGYPDAFLDIDAGIKHALPGLSPRERKAVSEAWRPWRSYANISLWNTMEP